MKTAEGFQLAAQIRGTLMLDAAGDQASKFAKVFKAGLESLLPDLAEAPWYIREREVVNRFVFRHLVPKFPDADLDVSQLGIEVPVQVFPESNKAKPSVYADIVVWRHGSAGVWLRCKPLARVEWKNISCRDKTGEIWRRHQEDVSHLRQNATLAFLNYAVITSRRRGMVRVSCKQIMNGTEAEFYSAECVATGLEFESAINNLGYREAMLRTQTCNDCIPS
jgi:hypothetical protein